MMPETLLNEDEHAKALRMMERDLVGWFTTIGRDGAPRAVPVWFWWEDGRVYVITKHDAHKLTHIRRGSAVLFHLNAGGAFGDDVVILHGSAEISDEPAAEWLAPRREAYTAKYAAAIEDFGVALDDITAQYDTVIVVNPHRVQTW